MSERKFRTVVREIKVSSGNKTDRPTEILGGWSRPPVSVHEIDYNYCYCYCYCY
jgi:hypothetical protein